MQIKNGKHYTFMLDVRERTSINNIETISDGRRKINGVNIEICLDIISGRSLVDRIHYKNFKIFELFRLSLELTVSFLDSTSVMLTLVADKISQIVARDWGFLSVKSAIRFNIKGKNMYIPFEDANMPN